MIRHSFRTLLVVGAVLLAGCAGGLTGSPAQSTPTDATQTADGGTVSFYISDQQNAIGDFEHLNVTVTGVGFQRTAGNDSGWVERDVNNTTVDLTKLQGANATLIDEYDVPNGTYGKVFVHVGEVNATLQNGDSVNVKLPSEKLQIQKNFSVANGSEVDFVFDIAVHKAGNSGRYILRPVISESGTDVPIESTDGERANEADEDDAAERDLALQFVGPVSPGANATVRAMRNGTAVANATVVVNGDTVGTTNADGEHTFTVPDTDSLTVTVRTGDAEAELEREFENG